MKKIKNVLLVLMPILLGSLVGFCVKDDFSYLNTIPHNINLPGFIFIIAWSIIYILSGIWSYLYNKKGGNLTIYFLSLALNLLFTPLLFSLHQIIASLILVMNNGDVIESGNHEELMKKNGFYANLYNSQFDKA